MFYSEKKQKFYLDNMVFISLISHGDLEKQTKIQVGLIFWYDVLEWKSYFSEAGGEAVQKDMRQWFHITFADPKALPLPPIFRVGFHLWEILNPPL